ncbi:MAG: hypothetical protein JRJ05_08615 [Deltaproteobacteria bacterium]|nr:hypothetical protein [Deltaproteobacteria bacterium]MBW2692093.1 hypothetical protein [Deltaproteobacteria bacterium]
MSTGNESIAGHVGRLKTASVIFLVLAWLVWAEFALGVGIGLTVLSDYVSHWSVFLVLFFAYAFLSACLFIASWALNVLVYIFEDLKLVV